MDPPPPPPIEVFNRFSTRSDVLGTWFGQIVSGPWAFVVVCAVIALLALTLWTLKVR